MEQGQKFDKGKPRLDLLSAEALTQIASVMSHGASKYGDHNWRKGIAWSRVMAAILRHLQAFNAGEDLDPESGVSHLAHAGCGIMFLLEYSKYNKDLDDRYKRDCKLNVNSIYCKQDADKQIKTTSVFTYSMSFDPWTDSFNGA